MKKAICWTMLLVLAWPVAAERAPHAVSDVRSAARVLAQELTQCLVDEGVSTVAVLPFTDLDEQSSPLGKRLALSVQGELSGGNAPFDVVERQEVDEVLSELRRGTSKLYDASSVVEIGGLLLAEVLISGSVDVSGDPLSATARIIRVKTREILDSVEVGIARDGVAPELLRTEIRRGVAAADTVGTAAAEAPAIRFSADRAIRNLDRRGGVVLVWIENLLDEAVFVGFAQGGFGKCDVSLLSRDQRDYRLVGNRRGETEIGAGGLSCVKKGQPRSAYTRLEPRARHEFPLFFRANVDEEVSPGSLTLVGKYARLTRDGRKVFSLQLSDID